MAKIDPNSPEGKLNENMRKISAASATWYAKLRHEKPSASVIDTGRKSLKQLSCYMSQHGLEIVNIDRESFVGFCRYLAGTGMSLTSKSLYFRTLKGILRFLMHNKMIKPFDMKDLEFESVIKGAKSKTRLVPSFDDILKLRQLPVPIEWAVLIECLMSSGLRVSEFCQLRMCDLKLGDVPIDIMTGAKSQFASCSVLLNSNIHTIKNRTSRVTFFSRFAYRLLKTMLKINKTDFNENSVLPIFPWSESAIDSWFDDINGMIKFESANAATRPTNLSEEFFMSESDIEKLDPRIRELVRRRIAEKISNIEEFPVSRDNFSNTFTLHSLRHVFTCVQMYRDYRGGRSDEFYVRSLLGHRTRDTILRYLSKLTLLKTDDEWNRIMTGGGGDWSKIVMKRDRKVSYFRLHRRKIEKDFVDKMSQIEKNEEEDDE